MKKLPEIYIVECATYEQSCHVITSLFPKASQLSNHWRYIVKLSEKEFDFFDELPKSYSDLKVILYKDWSNLFLKEFPSNPIKEGETIAVGDQMKFHTDYKADNTETLSKLGSTKTQYVYDKPSPELLETFENQFPERRYVTEFVFNEFTSLCPKTGQPDFATITIRYIADKKCIETKSLKMYLLSYRMYGTFMETLTNNILDHLVAACDPIEMEVISNFNARGGTLINVKATYGK